MTPLSKKHDLKKGIYILPSIFTCGNMTFGFLSMLLSVRGHFTTAAWFIVGGIVCDMLDGRIARLTKTTSEFGVQLDSLSDLVSFGIAPAMMMYELVLKNHDITRGKLGIAIAVLFVLCSALRLAKFNAEAADGVVHSSFQGLPTPASAGVIISFVLSHDLWLNLNAPAELFEKYSPAELAALNFRTIPILINAMPKLFLAMPIVMIILSFLMVSPVPYLSFKTMRVSKFVALRLFVLIIILVLLIVVFPQNIFFLIFFGYALSGIIFFIPVLLKKRRRNANYSNGYDEHDKH
ncbi:MAG: CDP-diacylglycerol--serine O-phosphatidyltransferase [Spirochaetaceae bacterium]|jgi:CDP-diacylglycerol--serine O-phosphatidyltransferase|nr:CDP-diacylglycerol--serine O-phosphatidyltransferase [Spirochaetaceae bacterium]